MFPLTPSCHHYSLKKRSQLRVHSPRCSVAYSKRSVNLWVSHVTQYRLVSLNFHRERIIYKTSCEIPRVLQSKLDLLCQQLPTITVNLSIPPKIVPRSLYSPSAATSLLFLFPTQRAKWVKNNTLLVFVRLACQKRQVLVR